MTWKPGLLLIPFTNATLSNERINDEIKDVQTIQSFSENVLKRNEKMTEKETKKTAYVAVPYVTSSRSIGAFVHYRSSLISL